MMKNLIYLLSILSLNLALFSQENNVENIEVTPSKIEQLIIDIESEVDIEKRFHFYQIHLLALLINLQHF